MKNKNVRLILFFLLLILLTAAAFFLEDRTAKKKVPVFLERADIKQDAAVDITFSEEGIDSGDGTAVDGKTVLILSGGTYRLSGKSTDARILVMSKKQKVVLILDGLDLSYSSGSPLFICKSPLTVIKLEKGTVNRLSDTSDYDYSDRYSSKSRSEPSAVIYSRKDLVIQGKGTLILEGSYRDAISSLQSVGVFDCTLYLSSPRNGIRAAKTIRGDGCYIHTDCDGDPFLTDGGTEGEDILFTSCGIDKARTSG